MKQVILFKRLRLFMKNLYSYNASFKKIITFYTIITIIVIIGLSTSFQTMIYTRSKNNIQSQNSVINNAIIELVNQKYFQAHNAVKTLYANANYQETIITFLDIGMDEFLLYSLDQFYKTNLSPMKLMGVYFENIVNADPSIQSISLYSNNEFIYTYERANSFFYRQGTEKAVIYSKIINELNLSGNYSFQPHVKKEDGDYTFDIIIRIQDSSTLVNKGYLIFTHNLDSEIDTILQSGANDHYGDFILAHNNGTVLYDSSNRSFSASSIKEVIATSDASVIESSNFDHHFFVTPIGSTDLALINFTPTTLVYKLMRPTSLIIIVSAILSIALIVFLTFTYSRSYSYRLKTITDAIDKIKTGDFTSRIQLDSRQDELGSIAQNFNDMCHEIENYIDKVYVLQLKQKAAELEALQAQINPHFLYNTLENIRMRAAINNDMDVSKMIYILATFFRKSLNYDTIITIEEEISHSRLYLQLFQIQYMDKLHVDIDIDPAVLSYSIIKLSIQPIVENYIVHGINLNRNDNKINIKGFIRDEEIWITISDNGCGIDQQTLESIRSTLDHSIDAKSIGLINVHERLQIQYGNAYGLSIESALEVGTTVTLRLPCQKRLI